MKASAVAHPIQGLVKYHGLRDPVRRIPFHESISVCTGPIRTHTTVEVDSEGVVIDGEAATGRARERIDTVLDAVREAAGDDRPCRVESRSDFPQRVGLGSSSSGFAALAVAAAAGYGVEASVERLSQFARLGSGSAARSVAGCVAAWRLEGERSWGECLATPEQFPDWRIVVPLIRSETLTDGVHADVVTSPLFEARVAAMPAAVARMQRAVADRDFEALAALAEADTLSLHAVTMTGEKGVIAWQPGTLEIIHRVRELRADGVPVWFSIDTGATPYLNTTAQHEDAVAAAVADAVGVVDVLHLRPAGGARVIDEHLF